MYDLVTKLNMNKAIIIQLVKFIGKPIICYYNYHKY